jgi:hypothetical protein
VLLLLDLHILGSTHPSGPGYALALYSPADFNILRVYIVSLSLIDHNLGKYVRVLYLDGSDKIAFDMLASAVHITAKQAHLSV